MGDDQIEVCEFCYEPSEKIRGLRAEVERLTADEAKLQAAYDAVKSGHGWCRCHNVVDQVAAEVERLRVLVGELLEGVAYGVDDYWRDTPRGRRILADARARWR